MNNEFYKIAIYKSSFEVIVTIFEQKIFHQNFALGAILFLPSTMGNITKRRFRTLIASQKVIHRLTFKIPLCLLWECCSSKVIWRLEKVSCTVRTYLQDRLQIGSEQSQKKMFGVVLLSFKSMSKYLEIIFHNIVQAQNSNILVIVSSYREKARLERRLLASLILNRQQFISKSTTSCEKEAVKQNRSK